MTSKTVDLTRDEIVAIIKQVNIIVGYEIVCVDLTIDEGDCCCPSDVTATIYYEPKEEERNEQ